MPVEFAPEQSLEDLVSQAMPLSQPGPKPVSVPASTDAQPVKPASDTTKAPAEVDEPDDTVPNFKPTGEHWKNYKTKVAGERKALQAEIAVLRNEILGLKKTTVPEELTKRMESLKQERDQLDAALRRANLEQHPKFQEYFNTKTNAAVNSAKGHLGEETAKALSRISQLEPGAHRDAMLEKLFEDMPPWKQGIAASVLTKFDEIAQERAFELNKAHDNIKALEEQQSAELKTRESQFESEFQSLQEEWGKAMPAFVPRENDDDWNAQVNSRWDEAKKLAKNFSGLPAKEQIKAAAWVQAGPALAKQNVDLLNEINKLNERIAKLNGGSPNIGATGGSGGGTNGKTDNGQEQSLDDLVSSIAERTGLKRV